MTADGRALRARAPTTVAPTVVRIIADSYQNAVAGLTVLLMSTGFTLYLTAGAGVDVPAFAWLGLLGLLAIPLALRPHALANALQSHMPVWCALYFLATLLAYLRSSFSPVAAHEMQIRLLTCALLPMFALIFGTEESIATARKMLVAAVLIGVGVNLYELTHPGAFSTVLGRSAGLYANPNISAKALVIGMTLSIGVLPLRWREAYVVAAGGGIALTLSRSMLICYVFAVGAYWLLGGIRLRRLTIAALVVVPTLIGAALVYVGPEKAVAGVEFIVERGFLDRIINPSIAAGGGDYSANLRMQEAAAAIEQFREHPILGNGVASTIEWEVHASTHNIYLRHLAEYGIAGVLLFPLLILAIVGGARAPVRRDLLVFAGTALIAGMFSHNVLDERDTLVAIGLAAAMSAQSRRSPADSTTRLPASHL